MLSFRQGASRFHSGFISRSVGLAAFLVSSIPSIAQQVNVSPPSGNISGTVTDADHAIVPGASVVLEGPGTFSSRRVLANDNGAFDFANVEPGGPYYVAIHADGLISWNSPPIMLDPGQFVTLSDIAVRLSGGVTSVTVSASSAEIAVRQVHTEEQQRVLGFVPNYYVVYDSQNAVPLTAKLKFELAMKVVVNPVTGAGVAFMAATRQAGNTPDYVQGAKGYGQRVGAEAADGFSDILIGGAILPSLLHQDPRYFYQGTGTTGSRLRHALFSPFVARGDNGRWQPNYSTVGGDLAASALMNTYYPQSTRGARLVFGQFAINTAEREMSSVMQEFVLPRLTRRARPGN